MTVTSRDWKTTEKRNLSLSGRTSSGNVLTQKRTFLLWCAPVKLPLNRFTHVESIQPGFQVLSNGHESIQRTRFNGFKFNRRRPLWKRFNFVLLIDRSWWHTCGGHRRPTCRREGFTNNFPCLCSWSGTFMSADCYQGDILCISLLFFNLVLSLRSANMSSRLC